MQLKRTGKVKAKECEDEPPAKSEVKVWFSPVSVVEIELGARPPEEDLTRLATKDGTPHDPTQPVERELIDCILKQGLPEGALAEAPAPARGRKRKTNADGVEDGSPSSSQKKPRPSQETDGDFYENAGEKKRGKPRKKPHAGVVTAEPSSRKSGGKKQSDSKPRSPNPPSATLQLPKSLKS